MNKRNKEGYVLIDHRNSPGISPEFLRINNLTGPAVGSGQVFESAMYTCCSCGADVILNPNRTRDREWCWHCDSFMCDGCAYNKKMGMTHLPLKKKYADYYDSLNKETN